MFMSCSSSISLAKRRSVREKESKRCQNETLPEQVPVKDSANVRLPYFISILRFFIVSIWHALSQDQL